MKFRDSWVEVPEIEVVPEFEVFHEYRHEDPSNIAAISNRNVTYPSIKNQETFENDSGKQKIRVAAEQTQKYIFVPPRLERKEKLPQAKLSYHPREDYPFCLRIDVSDRGLGAQLFQMVGDERRMVAWAFRLLMERETRYHIDEKKALSIVWSTNRFLSGRKFVIYTI
ncbi:hypothetical protein JTB14_002876 [Gonioctena quinquepunctata]|nr:hypothetical protein JTB14_002876 [Gonioctena quinquepunctata]